MPRSLAALSDPVGKNCSNRMVAAGLSGKCGPGKLVCVVSGGNIDLTKFTELVTQTDA